jgi:hypothetical protein
MSRVEIVYNVISVIVAVLFMIGFTIYARRALDKMESSEGINPDPVTVPTGSSQFRNNHQGCTPTVRSVKDCEAVVLLYGSHVLFIGEQRRKGLQLNNQANPILTRARY